MNGVERLAAAMAAGNLRGVYGDASAQGVALRRKAADATLAADPALADAIELGLLLLGEDGERVLAEIFHEAKMCDPEWTAGPNGCSPGAHRLDVRYVMGHLAAKLREQVPA